MEAKSLYQLSLDSMPEGEDKEKYKAWQREHLDRVNRIIAKYARMKQKLKKAGKDRFLNRKRGL